MAGRALSRIVTGRVMHRRRLPREHRFVYPVFFLLLDMDGLGALDSWLFGVNRRRPLAFHFKDYGDGRDPRRWVREQLASCGVDDCDGRLWLQSFPRLFGYLFNPVSFWYCARRDGTIGAIIAEVNNTFGESLSYLLRPDTKSGRFEAVYADKRLYVSPFYPVSGGYRFRFDLDFDKPRVSIDYYDQGVLQLSTAVWGQSRSWSVAALLGVFLRQPLLTLGITIRIHWQALRLWLKGVPLAKKPTDTTEEPIQ